MELTSGSESQMGVMLVDMDYSSVSRMLERINTSGKDSIIICVMQRAILFTIRIRYSLMEMFRKQRCCGKVANSIYDDYLNGVHRKIMVDTISYTGWKLVCVMPYSIFTNKMADVKQFVLL